ncbi:MAG: hypothetical protein HGA93_04905 [Methanothrix sp.]|nr:hypothetical protein [Methanothrix sp.]
MFAKMLVAWAALVMVLTVQSQAQYDPLGSDIFTLPDDMRRTNSLDALKYFDSRADPLGLDPLMRPLDPEHTAEFLDKISGPKYIAPFVPLQEDLRGNWKLDLLGERLGRVDLLLIQNRDAVFGRGTLSLAGSTFAVSASGRAVRDALSLDLLNMDDLTLYRCTLTLNQGILSGSFNAFDAQGQAWSGTIQGGRSA